MKPLHRLSAALLLVAAAGETCLAAAAGEDPALERRVTVVARETPLAVFLDGIGSQAKVKFKLAPGLETRPVSGHFEGAPARVALEAILEDEGLTYSSAGERGTYLVSRLPTGATAPGGTARQTRPSAAAPDPNLDRPADIDAQGPLFELLDDITFQTKIRFIIAKNVENRQVKVLVKGGTLRDALQAAGAAQGLVFTQVGRSATYKVSRR